MLVTMLCTLAALTSHTPHQRFDELQDLTGYYANKVCLREAKRIRGEVSKTEAVRIEEMCDRFSDRLEHMVAVSGNDAIIQLHSAKRGNGKQKRRYYAEVVNTAGTGAHLQQLLKISRKATEWLFASAAHPPSDADISARLQPEMGQWLINVASHSDPHVTSKEMRDENPEEPVE